MAKQTIRTLVWVLVVTTFALGCEETPKSSARRVATRVDLVGGPSALGELGDFVLENNKIRIVIQDKGFSRGFGVYGGSLIDADRARVIPEGNTSGGRGQDQFGELFPAALLQALVPDKVEVLNDGSDGQEARIKVSGYGGDFLSLSKVVNRAALGSHVIESPADLLNAETLEGEPVIRYEVVYALRPNERFVRITVRMINESDTNVTMPSDAVQELIALAEVFLPDFDLSFLSPAQFRAPLGMVVLFGAGNQVFCPGVGYGLRVALEDAYRTNKQALDEQTGKELQFPALAGILTNGLITTSSTGISYGLFSDPKSKTPNFVKNRLNADGKNVYEELYGTTVSDDTMLVPFVASSFTGVFYAEAPSTLKPGQKIEYTTHFIIGDGDAASVLDVVYENRGTKTGLLTGLVMDAVTGSPLDDVSVIVSDADDNPINQFNVTEDGRIKGRLPDGKYMARVVRDFELSKPVKFSIKADQSTHIVLSAPTPARVVVTVRDKTGQLLPAKVTAMGRTGDDNQATEIIQIKHGLEWRTTDFDEDQARGLDFGSYLSTYRGRYIETSVYTEDGRATLMLPPGKEWELIISRGIEYTADTVKITGEPGRIVRVSSTLERVVDTTGYISADFHLHARPSLDSSLSLTDRVASMVGEGVEVLVATDHNFITDYAPTIEQMGLQDWTTSMIGLELTTLESGHFNAFPLKRQVGAMTKGAFEWSLKTPDTIFDMVRELGSLGKKKTVIQVNHPRDQILGYFDQYSVSPITAQTPGPLDCSLTAIQDNATDCLLGVNGPAFRDAEGNSTFSYKFDAIEVLNGSVAGQMMHKRMPKSIEGLRIDPAIKDKLPPAGTILCEGGEVAFPGVMDDWFNMLNIGYKYIGTGTSDSHTDDDHPGVGRTYLYVGDDEPRKMTDEKVINGLRSRRVIMTTGPFIEFTLGGKHIGSSVKAKDGKIEAKAEIQAAPWVKVNTGTLWANGKVLKTFPIELKNGRYTWTDTLELARDSWVVLRVTGDQSMFPIQRPVDIPPIQIAEALSSIAEPFGFGVSELGDLQVVRTGAVMPVAMTNPIWVDTDGDTDDDGDDFEPPGPSKERCVEYGLVDEAEMGIKSQALIREPQVETKWIRSFGYPRLRGSLHDVRAIFDQFSRHAH